MSEQNFDEWLLQVKELTELEYSKAEESARELVIRKLGDKPTLSQFRNKVGGQFNIIAVLLIVTFLGALTVSTFDIIKFVGIQVSNNDATYNYVGIPININVKAVSFQIAFVVLAEFSVILFLTKWRQYVKTNNWEPFNIPFVNFHVDTNKSKIIGQFFNIYFLLAFASISFVFYANFQSGVHWLLAVLPPFVTVGVGWVFEELITDWLSQLEKDEKEYVEANNRWTEINREPENDKNYQEYLMRSIWNSIKTKNQKYGINFDVDSSWKVKAVNRELKKAEWAKNAILRKVYETDDNKEVVISDLEILRDKMQNWSVDKGYIIETKDYVVNMKKFTIKNKITGETEQTKNIRGLKSKVTHKIKDKE